MALLGVVFAVNAQNASAVTLVNQNGSVAQPYQHWADLSDVPTVDSVVTVLETTCPDDPDALACVYPSTRQIFSGGSRPCGITGYGARRACRFVTMHELGHLFDEAQPMPDWKRRRFLGLIGTRPEWGYWGYVDREAFADAYALCSLHTREPPDGISALDMDRRTFLRACHIIRIPNSK